MRPDDLPLPQADLRSLAMLALALCSGPALLAVAALVLSLQHQGPPPDAEALEQIHLLSAVHVFLALGGFTAAALLFRARFYGAPFRRPVGEATAESVATEGFAAFRAATVLRFALMEAPALFGMTVCVLAALNGVLAQQPLVWLNALTAALLVGVAAGVTFPTEARVRAHIAERYRRATEGRGEP